LNLKLDGFDVLLEQLPLPPQHLFGLLLFLLLEFLLEVRDSIVEETAVYQNLLVQVQQPVVEFRVLALLLSYVDRLPYVFWKAPVSFILVIFGAVVLSLFSLWPFFLGFLWGCSLAGS